MTNSTDPKRGQHFVFSSPGPNKLQMISEDERSAFYRQGLLVCQYIFCIALCMMGIIFAFVVFS